MLARWALPKPARSTVSRTSSTCAEALKLWLPAVPAQGAHRAPARATPIPPRCRWPCPSRHRSARTGAGSAPRAGRHPPAREDRRTPKDGRSHRPAPVPPTARRARAAMAWTRQGLHRWTAAPG
ncbi:hypothetical protein G6F64_014722 [Rhizopus arrhizus]|uniref:Uncharacterized protein n=1 Tax=Rhizopus oryzae TaxID=64495 RepID=A0A9P6WSW5_RHIOR|nr:hypothetical protein G6F64_014722 [Rhizopus arrhizus]